METLSIKKGFEDEIFKVLKNRTEDDLIEIDESVKRIIARVRSEGDPALFDMTKEFDKVALGSLRVSEGDIKEAMEVVEDELLESLRLAAENIRTFHEKQVEKSWQYEKEDQVLLGQIITPLESVGIYVPGGKASYPSTVLMNAIPAKIANVARIVMVTPPDRQGKINPYVLAAAKIAGVDEIYKIGGAQAVAALGYGTETIKKVNKIVGPGNIFVARAKKYLYGLVDIDMIAGPSEICIIADDPEDVQLIAADLLSQAEHDEMAASMLITTSKELTASLKVELIKQLDALERKDIAQQAIKHHGLIIEVEDMESAFCVANKIAPEHLEIMLEDPMAYIPQIKNAGAVFLGRYSPEPLGDYFAGPNHTLPTSGTAAFASPLGVYDFLKRSSLIYYTEDALRKEKDDIIRIAEKEGLTAHANSIKVRFMNNEIKKEVDNDEKS